MIIDFREREKEKEREKYQLAASHTHLDQGLNLRFDVLNDAPTKPRSQGLSPFYF